jgi:ankyrin repeat protein
MIRSRGYSTRRFKTLQTAYYSKPSPLQQASYNVHLIEVVKAGDVEKLKDILACGISPNPCNQFGESLVHMICRRGEHAMLQALLDANCNLQVADDYGRTPLHDACWAAHPCFKAVDLILERDIRLFHMTDCRGAVPLSYVRKDHWSEWINYLESKKDVFWRPRNIVIDGEEKPPVLAMQGANTRPLVDPHDALTCELAAMVASGKMEPQEAEFLKYDRPDDETCDSSGDEDDSDDDDSEDDSDYDDSDDDSEFSMDDDEMADILNSLAVPRAKTIAQF